MKRPLIYFGATIHYISKNGRLIRDHKRSVAEIKKDAMTQREFDKYFYDPESDGGK
jgi:hypothetical protein